MASKPDDITADELALLDRMVDQIVVRRLELPAILTLETGRPLSLLASQTMIFFEPIVAMVLRLPDYRRFAQLIERRVAVEALIRSIETKAQAAAETRRAAARADRAARDARRRSRA
jgi:hypothetical protein